MANTFLSLPGVVRVHNLRMWALSLDKTALAAHLAIREYFAEMWNMFVVLLKRFANEPKGLTDSTSLRGGSSHVPPAIEHYEVIVNTNCILSALVHR